MPWNYIIAFPPFRQGQIKQTELILQKLLTFVTGHSQRSTAMVSRVEQREQGQPFPKNHQYLAVWEVLSGAPGLVWLSKQLGFSPRSFIIIIMNNLYILWITIIHCNHYEIILRYSGDRRRDPAGSEEKRRDHVPRNTAGTKQAREWGFSWTSSGAAWPTADLWPLELQVNVSHVLDPRALW